MKYCPKCGFSMESDAPFCGNCGFDFGSVRLPIQQKAPKQPESAVPSQQIQNQPVIQPSEKIAMQNISAPVQTPEAVQETEKKSKTLLIVLIIVGVLLIGGGTFFALEATDVINLFNGIGENREVEESEKSEDKDDATDKNNVSDVTDEKTSLDNISADKDISGQDDIIDENKTETVWILNEAHYEMEYSQFDKVFEYDDNYNLISIKDVNAYGETFNFEYSYDSKGNVLKEYEYGSVSTGPMYRYEYTYDLNDMMTCKRRFSVATGGQNTHTYTYEYDSDEKLLKIYLKNYDTELIYEYMYNANGDLQTIIEKNGTNGTELDRYEYEYDANGRLVKYETDNNNSSTIEMFYDEKGNMITENYYTPAMLYCVYEYTYDENGNMLTKEKYSNDGKLIDRYEYTYDENDNMIKRTRSNGKYVSETIEYTWSNVEVLSTQAEKVSARTNDVLDNIVNKTD